MAAAAAPSIIGRAAGPQATTIFTPSGKQPPILAQAPTGLPGLRGINIPTWVKWALIGAALLGGGLIVWRVVEHRKRSRSMPDYDF